MLIAALTLTALASSTLSAMAGLGGGTVLIAALYAAGLAPAAAVPLHAVVQLASNGSRSLAYAAAVEWRAVGLFLLGAVPAAFCVAPLLRAVDADLLRLVMAAFVVFCLWRTQRRASGGRRPGGLFAAGVLAGGAGMVVGAVGPLIAPFVLAGAGRRNAVIATLAVCGTLAHLTKIAALAGSGYAVGQLWTLALPMGLAAVCGSLLGRRLAGWIDERVFRCLFAAILALLALKLGWDGLHGLLTGE